MKIRRLERSDDRSKFSCGQLDLDRFFQQFAGQNQFKHHIGTTYVAVEGEELLGFVTVSAGDVPADKLPAAMRRKLPGYDLPVLRVGRMATSVQARGRGVGRAMMASVMQLAEEVSGLIGCVGVVVDAKADAVSFYESLGFVRLEVEVGELGTRPAPVPMFLENGQRD